MTRKEILKLEDMTQVDSIVKIAGTNYDRRRKGTTNALISKLRRAYAAGRSIEALAEKYDLSTSKVRYWVDDDYKAAKNSHRKDFKKSIPTKTRLEAAAERGYYKMNLVKHRKKVRF